jgi:hypothetical protein
VYVPGVEESTSPDDVIEEVISPSILSEAVAPASEYIVPLSILIEEEPIREITGNLISTEASTPPGGGFTISFSQEMINNTIEAKIKNLFFIII